MKSSCLRASNSSPKIGRTVLPQGTIIAWPTVPGPPKLRQGLRTGMPHWKSTNDAECNEHCVKHSSTDTSLRYHRRLAALGAGAPASYDSCHVLSRPRIHSRWGQNTCSPSILYRRLPSGPRLKSASRFCWPNSFLTCGCLAGFTSMTRRSPDRIHPALRHDVRSDTSRAQSMAHSSAGRRWCRRPDREHYQDKRSRDPIESRSCVHAATSQAASGECRAFCGPDGTPRNAKGHPAPVLVPPIATAPSVPHPSHSFLESVKL